MNTFWLQSMVSSLFSEHSGYLEGIFISNRIHPRQNPLLSWPRPPKKTGLKCCCNTAWLWVNKKDYSGPCSAVNWYAFISLWRLFGFEQLWVSSDAFPQLVVWSQQKNYQENTFCQLAMPRVHKQDHLAIISCQSQKKQAKECLSEKKAPATVRE